MLKNLAQLEITIENKSFRFLCDSDASTLYIKEALFQFQKYIGAVEDAAKARMEQEQAEKDATNEAMKEGAEPYEEPCQMNCQESSVS